MDKMISSDGQGVAVAHGNDQVQFRKAQFYSRGKRQCTTVNGMEGVKVNIP